jgi:hypothetical protein
MNAPSRWRAVIGPAVIFMGIILLWPLQPRPVCAEGGSDTLDELMSLLAQRRHGEADYHQEQYLSALKRPLQSDGQLLYDAPDHLEQRTRVPQPQSIVLDHGMLTIQSGRHSRTLPLSQMPQVAPLIDSIRATLAGDRPALERVFDLQFSGTLEHWQLQLQPRDPALRSTLSQIALQGARDAIREVRMQQQDGDRSLMHITPRE